MDKKMLRELVNIKEFEFQMLCMNERRAVKLPCAIMGDCSTNIRTESQFNYWKAEFISLWGENIQLYERFTDQWTVSGLNEAGSRFLQWQELDIRRKGQAMSELNYKLD